MQSCNFILAEGTSDRLGAMNVRRSQVLVTYKVYLQENHSTAEVATFNSSSTLSDRSLQCIKDMTACKNLV